MGTVKRNKQKGGKASGKLLTGVLTVIVAVCVSVYDFITDLPVYVGAGIRFAYYKLAKRECTFGSLLFESRTMSFFVFVVALAIVAVVVAILAAM